MPRIPALPDDTHDPEARAVMEEVRQAWGMPWNIIRGMAHNPEVVRGFLALHSAIGNSGLSPEDREVICMEMAVRNGCHYCVPAHRFVTAHETGLDGVDKEMIQQISRGETLAGEGRPARLQHLVRRLAETRGALSDGEFEDALNHGFDRAQLIAVVAEIAHCTLTNTFNRLADTELDAMLKPYRDGFP
ncbi:MAG: carboxymuconolactone decarboxylase family protein [Pseudomonadota bacterium]